MELSIPWKDSPGLYKLGIVLTFSGNYAADFEASKIHSCPNEEQDEKAHDRSHRLVTIPNRGSKKQVTKTRNKFSGKIFEPSNCTSLRRSAASNLPRTSLPLATDILPTTYVPNISQSLGKLRI